MQVNPQLQACKGLLKQLQTAQNPQLALQQALLQNPGLKQALEIARLGNGNIAQVAQFVANQTGNNLRLWSVSAICSYRNICKN